MVPSWSGQFNGTIQNCKLSGTIPFRQFFLKKTAMGQGSETRRPSIELAWIEYLRAISRGQPSLYRRAEPSTTATDVSWHNLACQGNVRPQPLHRLATPVQLLRG